jgi:hypothetical protein
MLLLTLFLMQRFRINTVTAIPILIPCRPEEQDGLATFLRELAQPQPVRVVTKAEFQSERGLKKVLSSMDDTERDHFLAVSALVHALQTKDKLAIARARGLVEQGYAKKREADRKLGITPARENDLEFGRTLIRAFGLQLGQEKEAIERWNGYRHGPRAEEDYRWLLSQLFGEALESTRLVLWWSGSQLRPAVYCPDLKAGLYVFFLMTVASGRGWGVCPYCSKFFLQQRSDQNYCTIAHREAHRVARWRAAKVARLKKKGGSNGPGKAR